MVNIWAINIDKDECCMSAIIICLDEYWVWVQLSAINLYQQETWLAHRENCRDSWWVFTMYSHTGSSSTKSHWWRPITTYDDWTQTTWTNNTQPKLTNPAVPEWQEIGNISYTILYIGFHQIVLDQKIRWQIGRFSH